MRKKVKGQKGVKVMYARVGACVQKNEVTKLKRIGFLVESES